MQHLVFTSCWVITTSSSSISSAAPPISLRSFTWFLSAVYSMSPVLNRCFRSSSQVEEHLLEVGRRRLAGLDPARQPVQRVLLRLALGLRLDQRAQLLLAAGEQLGARRRAPPRRRPWRALGEQAPLASSRATRSARATGAWRSRCRGRAPGAACARTRPSCGSGAAQVLAAEANRRRRGPPPDARGAQAGFRTRRLVLECAAAVVATLLLPPDVICTSLDTPLTPSVPTNLP